MWEGLLFSLQERTEQAERQIEQKTAEQREPHLGQQDAQKKPQRIVQRGMDRGIDQRDHAAQQRADAKIRQISKKAPSPWRFGIAAKHVADEQISDRQKGDANRAHGLDQKACADARDRACVRSAKEGDGHRGAEHKIGNNAKRTEPSQYRNLQDAKQKDR